MSHEHSHAHHAHFRSGVALKRALIVTLGFAGFEFAGGLIANSLALISDSVHMVTDAGALALSLFVVWVSRRKAPDEYTYGFQRVEILGALLNGLMVWLVAGILIFESFDRFRHPADVNGKWVFWVATVGLAANLIALFFLHRSSKENLNVKSAYLHVLTDSLGSVGAMIAGAVIALTGWREIDPLITVVLSALMCWSSWQLIREAVAILLERSPSHLRMDEIQASLSKLEGVKEVHDLHVWTLSSGTVALSAHLVSLASETGDLLHEATHLLAEKFEITHTTIQVEPENSEVAEHCGSCE